MDAISLNGAHDALSLRSKRKWQTTRTLYQAPNGGFLGDHIYHRYAPFVEESGCISAFDPIRPSNSVRFGEGVMNVG